MVVLAAQKAHHIHRYDYLSVYTLAEDILNNMDLLESDNKALLSDKFSAAL